MKYKFDKDWRLGRANSAPCILWSRYEQQQETQVLQATTTGENHENMNAYFVVTNNTFPTGERLRNKRKLLKIIERKLLQKAVI